MNKYSYISMIGLVLFLIPTLIVGFASGTFTIENYGQQFIEFSCDGHINIPQSGWGHLDGWCSVIQSQQKIIEQNDEIIKELKTRNCIELNKLTKSPNDIKQLCFDEIQSQGSVSHGS